MGQVLSNLAETSAHLTQPPARFADAIGSSRGTIQQEDHPLQTMNSEAPL
jgi:hypothetical protein